MHIPIFVDDREVGTLTMTRQGSMTEAVASLDNVGRIVRLTMYGEAGESGYFGVPEPKGDKLVLVRRLTPNERRRFPARPKYAAEHPMSSREETDAPRHVLRFGGRAYYF